MTKKTFAHFSLKNLLEHSLVSNSTYFCIFDHFDPSTERGGPRSQEGPIRVRQTVAPQQTGVRSVTSLIKGFSIILILYFFVDFYQGDFVLPFGLASSCSWSRFLLTLLHFNIRNPYFFDKKNYEYE